jgi:hypothetical protein
MDFVNYDYSVTNYESANRQADIEALRIAFQVSQDSRS